jgi:hypothetical protein
MLSHWTAVNARDVIKDDFGGKSPSGRPFRPDVHGRPHASAFTPRKRFYPRTGFYRPPMR